MAVHMVTKKTFLLQLNVYGQAGPAKAFTEFSTRGFFYACCKLGEVMGYPGWDQTICKVQPPHAG